MGKNYVESSLKRFLKRKVKITMGFVVAFMIMGTGAFAEVITEPINKEGIAEAYKVTITDDININSNNSTGIQLNSLAVKEDYHDLKIESKDININLSRDGNCRGINNLRGSKLTLGKNETENIKITVATITNEKGVTIGIANLSPKELDSQILGSEIIVNGKKAEINVKTTDGTAVGVQTQHNTNLPHNQITDNIKVAKVEINSKDTVINVNSINGNAVGLACFSNSNMNIKGNLTVNAKSENSLSVALNARGNSILNINQDGDKKVILNGDIYFQHEGTHEGEKDTRINLNLSTKDSILNGRIYRDNEYIDKNGTKYDYTNLEYSENNGMLLSLSNDGTWEVTGDSFVNDLTMNAGVLKVTDNAKKIVVDELHGNSGTALFAASIGDGEVVVPGKVEVKKVTDKTAFKIGLSGVNADDLAANDIGAADALNKLVGKVTGSGVDNITQTAVIERGTLIGEITAELNKDGFTNMKQAQDTPTTVAIRDLTAINFLSWKQEMSSLSQRMGELRDSSAEHGVWARVYGGKVENGSQYDNEYQTYQVGYDKKYTVDNGRVYLGYLVSYTDGETDYSYGTGENYSVGAGIYATWMNNNGHYVDVLYKVSRLNNKFDMKDVEDVKGDYDTYGISLSAEYGKRFDITDKWFAEPSVGMHLGRLGDETYTTDGGIEISQDSIYTAEGRVGAAVGYKFSDKGNIYVRTHVVKEFAGEVDTEYERKGVYASTSEDFGDTWFEFGVGVNYRFTENMNVYADIERTGDSTVDTKWQGNLGFRYEF
ncbi:autotransporter outer membrane beta-barrel domain-containing protein (plasmid) [Fusobacterium sp. SB021]|uniref:autotransporter outer membrane beta-barrel domain-containing protein n=1 Tax=Fusobacterium sp. SB021 TaxID=2744227 RepID=UPI003CEE8238